MSRRTEIKRLVVTSPARNYEVAFHPGVNVIAGPISTGKSSILELIDYAFGAKDPPRYPELSKCSDVILDTIVGEQAIVLRRSLKEPAAKALVYEATLDDVLSGEATPTEVLPRHAQSQPSISLAILRPLSLGEFKVKVAPSKDASDTSSFSLRDLLRLIYIDQDRMGSKASFWEGDWIRANKWKAAFEIVHEVFDATAAGLAEALQVAERQEHELVRHFESVRRFLDQFRVPGAEALEQNEVKLGEELAKARDMQAQQRAAERTSLGASAELAVRRNAIADQERNHRARSEELRRAARQLGRLKVQYERELKQWEFLAESQLIMGSIPVSRCPACFQSVTVTHGEHCHLCKQELQKQTTDVPVENRIRAVKRRITDLEAFLEDLGNQAKQLDDDRAALTKEIEDLDHRLRRIQQSTLIAETRAILQTNEAISLIEQKLERVREQLAYRRRAQGDGSNLAVIRENVARLRDEIKRAEESRLSPIEVTKDLSAWYQALLSDVKFPALRDAYVDAKSYHPHVRNQPYPELSSKGAISLAVVMWHFAVLEYALKPGSRSRFPRLLMLDSPLSHIGRKATEPEFRDQKIVDAFYATLSRLQARAGEFQILIVDNAPPPEADELLAVQFTGDPQNGRYGLIDDEHPLLPADAGGVSG